MRHRPLQGHDRGEPVHVRELGGGVFRLLHSPGLVRGIAAGDEFRILNADGAFTVVTEEGPNGTPDSRYARPRKA